MPDLDLVPTEYRARRRVKHWLGRFAGVYLAVVALIGGGKAMLAYGIDVEAAEIARLQADKSLILGQKARLDALTEQRDRLTGRLEVLEKLRGGGPARQMFVTMDAALNDDVWFLNWKFARAGEVVPAKPKAVERGYFIIIPKDERQATEQAWRVLTHMEVKGQALDHAALAAFVDRLSRAPVISDVKILNTRVREYPAVKVVDFQLAIVVDDFGKSG